MAITIEECEEMVEAARAAGKKLMIDQNQRFARAHVRAKELLDAGRIGKVLTFRTAFGHGGPETWSVDPGTGSWFFDPKRAAMGAMADLGVHKTDLVQWLIGQTVVAATAKIATLDKRDPEGNLVDVDDNAMCIYQMGGGAMGTMTASWTYYGPEDNSTVIYGTEGIMRILRDPDDSIVVDLATASARATTSRRSDQRQPARLGHHRRVRRVPRGRYRARHLGRERALGHAGGLRLHRVEQDRQDRRDSVRP